MKTLRIKDVIIGEGMPKVCVPLTGSSKQLLQEEIELLKRSEVDLVEWRMDLFELVDDVKEVLAMLQWIHEGIDGKVLLATFRTMKEGGQHPFSNAQYVSLYHALLESKLVDLIDIELFIGEDILSELIQKAHARGISVILSNHDFHKTPSIEEMVTRMCAMQRLDGDICKLAVMPQQKQDVLSLLYATLKMNEQYADRPIVTMSMSKDGVISRVCGEMFGSSITFASLKKRSAPGQIPVADLTQLLSILHTYQ